MKFPSARNRSKPSVNIKITLKYKLSAEITKFAYFANLSE